ncbi:DUF3368 domain-containing protein [Spongiactinospora sp. TRM90649]|uniref:DUF3368 domain-containing protein n=1 Tax=Spongiactinospora sp. TRM90649 TaxID=3031114 RepID=UPI0023F7DC88|nr:DUF3368 domain-containing protein [Spongiactinospora sp. TRM90649]MDF5754455.1 DUF3368 domain-containing protein [Spongiactinospora sp. TRM90649]
MSGSSGSFPHRALVFDATCLSHFARAERLDVLRDLLVGENCLTTSIIRDELRTGLDKHPLLRHILDADWLGVERLESIEELRSLVAWQQRIGSSQRNLGEASVFCVAETSGAIAITDDREAVAVARSYGLEVHGTVWLLAIACREGKLSEVGAGNIIDALIATGMRLPCDGTGFLSYARRSGIR